VKTSFFFFFSHDNTLFGARKSCVGGTGWGTPVSSGIHRPGTTTGGSSSAGSLDEKPRWGGGGLGYSKSFRFNLWAPWVPAERRHADPSDGRGDIANREPSRPFYRRVCFSHTRNASRRAGRQQTTTSTPVDNNQHVCFPSRDAQTTSKSRHSGVNQSTARETSDRRRSAGSRGDENHHDNYSSWLINDVIMSCF